MESNSGPTGRFPLANGMSRTARPKTSPANPSKFGLSAIPGSSGSIPIFLSADRLMIARELLSETGSVFVQIGDENVHLVRCLLDEVFGSENFVSLISLQKTSGSPIGISNVVDYLFWYAKARRLVKYRATYLEKVQGQEGATQYNFLEENQSGQIRFKDDED